MGLYIGSVDSWICKCGIPGEYHGNCFEFTDLQIGFMGLWISKSNVWIYKWMFGFMDL